MATRSLYVGNLSYSTTEDELRGYFEPFGPVSDVRIISGRGFGFVDIPEEKLQDALDKTNSQEFQGRTLSVSEARPRTERSGAGSRDRGSYGGSRSAYGNGGGRDRW